MLVVAVWGILNTACAPTAPTGTASSAVLKSAEERSEIAQRDAGLNTTGASANAGTASETWDLCLVNDAKIGSVHALLGEVTEDGHTLRRGELSQTLTMERFGQKIQQELWLTCWESPQGDLVRYESRVTSGREPTISKGIVSDGKLAITTVTPGKSESVTIDWKAGWGGFFAVEWQLRTKPLKPGERRTIHALVPVLHQVVESQLVAEGYEATRIGKTSEQLLKVRKTDILGKTRIDSTLWVDEHGDVRKQFLPMPAPGMTVVRGTREEATSAVKDGAFDLGESTIVRVKTDGANLETARRVTYRAELTSGTIEGLFAQGASQQVAVRDERSAEITVRAIRPGDPERLDQAESPPVAADRSPNGLVQSDDQRVVALAGEVAPDEKDAWRVAVALEQHVKKLVKTKNFSQAFATAAEVAESREGDCTEHAVLLAALCRARAIPARVAIGLVYAPSLGGFAYHMWNEVWIKDRWVPLDSTLGRQGIGAAHLKIVSSNLEGYDAYSAFLPVFQVLGRLKLSVIRAE